MIWGLDANPPRDPALIDLAAGRTVTYGELSAKVANAAAELTSGDKPSCAFLGTAVSVDAIVLYLACLEANVAVALLDPGWERGPDIVDHYRPSLLLWPDAGRAEFGASLRRRLQSAATYCAIRYSESGPSTNPELALLLATSGSTGNPKLVRLSRRNIESNAASIATYLRITPDERAVAYMPIHYSFGLSIINSHLLVGASLVLTRESFVTRNFWQAIDDLRCTSFSGVPYTFEVLHRLRYDPATHPTVRTYTQAGGALSPELVRQLGSGASRAGARFFVMYGQTEASPRIAYVPSDRVLEKPDRIGVPVPSGRLWLEPVEDGPYAELVYEGPNVMLGYAVDRADLVAGDVMKGRLRTGDLGTVDKDGFFAVTGRRARFAKLFGTRLSLDDLESAVQTRFQVRAAAVEDSGRLVLFVETLSDEVGAAIRRRVADELRVPPPSIEVRRVESLAMTASGKKDYQNMRLEASR